MKRTVVALGLAALAVACFGGELQAQQAPLPTQTRVALVNIGHVFTKYDKAKTYKGEMEELLRPVRLEAEKLKKEMIDWSEAMKSPKFDVSQRERYERGIVDNKRKLEDLEREAKRRVGKKQEDQITTLYKEVQDAVGRYAQANGIHLVLAYGEQTEGDLFSFPNINRKMQGMDLGSTNPFVMLPGVDISQAIVDNLNTQYRASGGAAPVSATPVSLPKN